MKFTTVKRLYYSQVRAIIRGSRYDLRQQTFDRVCYAYLLFRCTHIFIMFWTDFRYPVYYVDYYAEFGHRYPTEFNSIIAFVITMAVIFGTFAQRLLYTTPTHSLGWQLIADMVVRNIDIYHHCYVGFDNVENRHVTYSHSDLHEHHSYQWRQSPSPSTKCCDASWWQRLLFGKNSWFHQARARHVTWWWLDHVDKERLMRHKLRYFPYLSLESRTWLLLTLDVIDLFEYPLFLSVYSELCFNEC